MQTSAPQRSLRSSSFLKDIATELNVDGDVEQVGTTDPAVKDPRKTDSRHFVTCGKAYQRIDSLRKHEDILKGDPPNRKVLNRVAQLAREMVDNGDAWFYTSSNSHPFLSTVHDSDAFVAKYSVMNCWERRPRRGRHWTRTL